MYRYRLIAAFLALTATTFFIGCGGSEDPPAEGDNPAAEQPTDGTTAAPTASISGPNSDSPYAVSPQDTSADYGNTTVDPNSPYANGIAPTTSPEPRFAETQFPVVQLNTNFGPVTIQLNAQAAPATVTNFLSHVMTGQYDGTIFHEVLDGANRLIIGGGYTTEYTEKPCYSAPVPNEATNGLPNKRGTIAMARRPENVNSDKCQFFFNVTDNPVLDHTSSTLEGFGYCVFGEVTSGMEIIDRIASSQVRQQGNFQYLPAQAVVIQSATRIR